MSEGPYRPVPPPPVCRYPHYDIAAATWGRGFPRGLWIWRCQGCAFEQSALRWNARWLKHLYVQDDLEHGPDKFRRGSRGSTA